MTFWGATATVPPNKAMQPAHARLIACTFGGPRSGCSTHRAGTSIRKNGGVIMSLVVPRSKKRSSPAECEGNRYLFAVSWSCSVVFAAWCNACAPASPPVTTMEADSDAIWLRKSCEAGFAADCHALGVMYTFGHDLPCDEARAAELFGNACDRGNAAGCVSLGHLLEKGRGYEGRGPVKDEARAAELFGNACNRGNAAGCVSLGRLYQKGRGVTKDDARAAGLYRKGCDGGEAEGCLNLGVAYAEGRGVPRDDTRAKELFRNVCNKGYEEGCHWLLHSYAEWPGAWPR
ncbi:Hypothetical protein A7982_04185 [Minicystis rosea]|nr:Hypothetical protein A7982_04185 [Minicystis rosea]